MHSKSRRLVLVLVALAIPIAGFVLARRNTHVAAAATASATVGKVVLRGLWSVGKSTTADLVHLGLRYTLHGSDNQHWGSAVPIARLEGFDPAAFRGGDAPVTFRVVRDAGTIECRGSAGHGEGAGTFGLILDPTFAEALERRGVGRPNQDEQIRLALSDAGFALLDALARFGYPKPDVAWMIRLGDHGAHEDFVEGLADEGYRLGSLTRLVQARDHGVDAHFIRGMRVAGYPHLTYAELLRARDHGADPSFIADMRALGVKDASIEEIIKLRDHGVTADYVAEMRAAGYKRATLEDLRIARDHGVTAEYVADLADAGFERIPLSQIIRARDHGVSGPMAKRVRAELGDEATIDDVIARSLQTGR